MKRHYFLMLLCATITMFSCGDDDDNTPSSIVELAQGDEDLSILVEALTTANLVTALSADGPFTVLAPTNAAFQDLLDANDDWDALSDIPNNVLNDVLLFHVIPAEVRSTQLSDTYVNTLSTGPNGENISLQVNTTGEVTFNGDSKPITTDIEASNGIIHTIDKVMLPPNIVSLAINNSGFSTLVSALTDSRHTTDFVSVLSGSGPFTVFAPSNTAFQELLDSNSAWNGLGDIPIATLEAVLSYHVVSGNVQSTQLSDGQSVNMFDGGETTIDLSNGAQIVTTSGQIVNIVTTDVQGTNGVIHVVDKVMLP